MPPPERSHTALGQDSFKAPGKTRRPFDSDVLLRAETLNHKVNDVSTQELPSVEWKTFLPRSCNRGFSERRFEVLLKFLKGSLKALRGAPKEFQFVEAAAFLGIKVEAQLMR
jgi:hypothetical protein